MPNSKNHSRSLVTPEFRMSFPSLIHAKPFMKDGKPTGKESFQVEAIFDEEVLANFQMWDEAEKKYVAVNLPQLLVQLANEAWPNMTFAAGHSREGQPMTVKELFDAQNGKGWPIQRGDAIAAKREAKGKKGDAYVGKRVISFKSNKADNVQPPNLSMVTSKTTFKTLNRTNDVDMEKAKNIFQGGNYAFATVSFVAMTVSDTRFLTPYLNGIRYTREGARLGGASEMDRFDGVSGGSSAHNPTDGMDEEIPF